MAATDGPPLLILAPDLRRGILADCRARFPAEACGLLLGRDEPAGIRIAEVVAAPNVDPRPDRFEVDPAILFATHRRLRAAGAAEAAPGAPIDPAKPAPLRLVGHYHSHPHGPARPSACDRRRASEPGAIWVIAASAPETGEAEAFRAFLFDDPDFREMAILLDP